MTIEKANGSETAIIVKKKKLMMDEGKFKGMSSPLVAPPSEVDIMGFTLIVQAIIAAKRPIIGHYFGLDLFYFYDHFIERLPDTFLEFVVKITDAFPYMIDTKVIAKKL